MRVLSITFCKMIYKRTRQKGITPKACKISGEIMISWLIIVPL